MRAVASIVMRNKIRKDGTYPLALRIYKNAQTHYVNIGVHVLKADWDSAKQRVKKSYPNSARANNLIAKKLADATDTMLEVEARETKATADTIMTRVVAPLKGKGFFAVADEYLQNLKDLGKFNRISADEPRIRIFKEFTKGEIAFEHITPILLNAFHAHLRSSRPINERTAVNYLVVIRTIFNMAIKSNIVDRKHYPFGHGKVVIRFPETLKVGLTEDEVRTLSEMELETGSNEMHARNIWLFSFYTAGMRVSDVLRLKWDNIVDGRLHYTMGKNAKAGSLKLPTKALDILEYYRNNFTNAHRLVFPYLSKVKDIGDSYAVQKRINATISLLDPCLKSLGKEAGITKKLTMHIARHTFGNLSGEKIPLQMLQKLYRHTSITTTIDYQKNFMFKDTDEALETVVNF